MSRKSRRNEMEIDDLNLIPIMGLLCILIPTLLLMVVFTKIGVININAPKLAVGPATEEPQEDDKKPLNLTVGISDKGFTIAATGGVLPGEEAPDPAADPTAVAAKPEGPTIPARSGGPCDGPNINPEQLCGEGSVCSDQCGSGNACVQKRCLQWDQTALYNRMVEIKEAYPEETVVNVGADDTVRFGTLVATMDSIRVRLAEDKYDKQETFDAAEVKKDGEGNAILLFSDVVMAVIQ